MELAEAPEAYQCAQYQVEQPHAQGEAQHVEAETRYVGASPWSRLLRGEYQPNENANEGGDKGCDDGDSVPSIGGYAALQCLPGALSELLGGVVVQGGFHHFAQDILNELRRQRKVESWKLLS